MKAFEALTTPALLSQPHARPSGRGGSWNGSVFFGPLSPGRVGVRLGERGRGVRAFERRSVRLETPFRVSKG
ncbi:MAG: hypothetical protein ACJ75H_09360 [Thermoanaerobaculia bacterium]